VEVKGQAQPDGRLRATEIEVKGRAGRSSCPDFRHLREEDAMRKWIAGGAVALLVALGAIQLVPVDTSNPPVTADVPASAAVKGILRRGCCDCHSNETQWPWYGRIAPVSWLLARDVREGRAELNFSTWTSTARNNG
jgi:Haem-binding domain